MTLTPAKRRVGFEAPVALERSACDRCGVPIMWARGRGRLIPFDLEPGVDVEPVDGAAQVYGVVHWFTCDGLYTVDEGRARLARLS